MIKLKTETAVRMEKFQLGIFSELSQFKNSMSNIEIVDFSIGSPDLPPHFLIREELAKQAMNEHLYGYSMKGSNEFHRAVSTFYQRHYNVTLNAENEVLMVSGSQDGLVHLPMAFANPGDIILVPDPGYTAYETGIAMAEATGYPMPLKKEAGYLPNLSAIPEDIAKQAKVMILNYPGNPVPALATEEFFKEVIAFANKYQIIVVHDFAYSEIYYDNHKPISFLSVPGAKEIGIEFNSLSKTFNMAGCRIGYICGNSEILNVLRTFRSNLDYGVFYPIQKAAIFALENSKEICEETRKVYQKRRNLLVDGLNSIGWQVEIPKASMFLWAKVPDKYASTQFTYELLKRTGVVVTPGNAFGSHGEGYVRIALVQNEEKIKKAIEKIHDSGIFC